MARDSGEIITPEDRELFSKIAADIRNNPAAYAEAGKWLDEYCSAGAYWQRQEKRLEELEELGKTRPNRPHNDREIADLKEKLEKRADVSLFKGFSRCRECWEGKYEDGGFVSKPDAKIIILITWLLSDPDAGETEPSITRLQKWAWEPTDDILSGSRSYASSLWRQDDLRYGAWMKLVRIVSAKLGEAPDKTGLASQGEKHALVHRFLYNVLRASIKHLPLVGSFLHDVIYGTLDSRPPGRQTTAKGQTPQTNGTVRHQEKQRKKERASEKWYQTNTFKFVVIPLIVALFLGIPTWIGLFGGDSGRSRDSGEVSTKNRVARSLKEICEDIDSRPLLQQEATAKNYIGIRIQREQVKLLHIQEYTEDGTFQLTMILPDQSDVSYLVVCNI